MPLRPSMRTNFRKPKSILVIDDSRHILSGVEHGRAHIESKGHTLHTASSFGEAKQKIHSIKPDLIFSDFQLTREHGANTGLHLAKEAKAANPNSEFRIHSMAAKELKAEREILARHGLSPKDIYEKRNLVRLLGLKSEHGVHFLPDSLEKVAQMQKHFNIGVMGSQHDLERLGLNASIKKSTIINTSNVVLEVTSRKPSSILVVGKNGVIQKSLVKSLGLSGIPTLPVASLGEAAKRYTKGAFILVSYDALEANAAGAEKHDAKNMLRTM